MLHLTVCVSRIAPEVLKVYASFLLRHVGAGWLSYDSCQLALIMLFVCFAARGLASIMPGTGFYPMFVPRAQ
jgi:uncharacterized protein involved in response to NO